MADNNINISPEMINNIMNMLKNHSDTNTNDNQQSNNQDTIFSQLNSNTENNSNNSSNIDYETIIKIKSIMETLNKKNDPRSNLLYSLKPYLRKGKQDKIDQYANLLKIAQVSNLLKNEKGDQK